MGYPIYHSAYTAAQIEAAIGKGPRVNASGYWEVWNVSAGDYESTGVGAGVTPPTVVTQVADMTNHGYIYIYNGTETGYTAGYWYYWDGTAWTAGGAYQVAATDTTLTIAGAAADAKATGDKLGELKSAFVESGIPIATNAIFSAQGSSGVDMKYYPISLKAGDYLFFISNINPSTGVSINARLTKSASFSGTEKTKDIIVGFVTYTQDAVIKLTVSAEEASATKYLGIGAIHQAQVSYSVAMFGEPLTYFDEHDNVATLNQYANAQKCFSPNTSIFEKGFIDHTGANYASDTSLRTSGYISSSVQAAKTNDGYFMRVKAYNKTTNAFVGTWDGTTFANGVSGITVTEFDFTPYSYAFRLTMSRTDVGVISRNEADNLLFESFVDTTLTQAYKSADAKVTGEKISGIESATYTLETMSGNAYALNFEQGEINTSTGVDSPSTIRIRSNAFVLDGYYDAVADGQEIGVCYYNGATFDGWTGWLGEEAHIVPADGYMARLVVRKPNNGTITPEENTVTVTKTSIIVKTVQGSAIAKNKNVFSVAHRGYAPNGQNHNKLEGYIAAAEHGFDYGETDLKETSDGILVCCHDTTFVDATSGDTVTIATSTYAELLTHDYYGGTIAKFEDVLKACKQNGIGLFIDQLGTASIINKAFDIVKKYQMLEHVVWLFGIGADVAIGLLKSKYPKAVIGIVSATGTLEQYVNYANSIAENAEKVIIDAPYTLGNGEAFATAMLGTAGNVYLALWTIDSVSTINSYLPYIVGYTSNLYSYNDLT